MSSDDAHSAAHADLVKALGDETALKNLGGSWMESTDWAEAVDRCAQRYPEVSRDEAFHVVGVLLGERYLQSDTGQVVQQSLRLVPRERVFTHLVPAMAARLRPGFSWNWESAAAGGVLRINGPRALPATVTLGFFEVMVRELGPTAKVTLGKVEATEFELVVSW
jgi:hypothetical protein